MDGEEQEILQLGFSGAAEDFLYDDDDDCDSSGG
ncbi:hypothetical protein TIFTF001_014747 [Ficus carica]|uniref:Uncharacterized protein n=1 Tax=Ficus carica TaxID=3494 RepID=A0AA88A3A8_FICCA|nr:hypothetical protein TIFTF001_014747 [Ficus carica]